MSASAAPRFLVVRRDNIGDLVLTTPLIAGLRAAHPDAWIGALVNTYNAPVLAGNPHLDKVFAYRKAKHGEASVIAVAIERVRLLTGLRRKALDTVILATPAWQPRVVTQARMLGARRIVGFVENTAHARGIDLAVSLMGMDALSEAERVWRLGLALGLHGDPPPACVVADAAIVARAQAQLPRGRRPIVGVHISARKPGQRWPIARFAELMRTLARRDGAAFMLFWAPGDAANPTHPGDDAKARELLSLVPDVRLLAWPSATLPELIGGLAACDRMVLADGGAMHIAAALGKPVLALFGNSDVRRWRPWSTAYELLHAPSGNVDEITVEQALGGYDRLTQTSSTSASLPRAS